MAVSRGRSRIKRLIRIRAVRRGLFGGSIFWRVVWALGTSRRLWSRVSKSGEAPVKFSEDLPEGEAYVISHAPEQSRRGRGEGRKFVIGPRRKPPHITSVAAGAAYAAARRALETPNERVADDRPAA